MTRSHSRPTPPSFVTAAILAACLAGVCSAAITLDWQDASVVETTTGPYTANGTSSAIFTGTTVGDAAIPFTATFTVSGGPGPNGTAMPLDPTSTRGGFPGGAFDIGMSVNPPGSGRDATSLVTVSIVFDPVFVSSFAILQYGLADVDTDSPPNQFAFVDEVQYLAPANTSISAIDPLNATFTLNNMTVTGTGNAPNEPDTLDDGSIQAEATFSGAIPTIEFVYRPGTGDLFTSNQAIAISDITIVPEPASLTLLAVGGLLLRRRSRA